VAAYVEEMTEMVRCAHCGDIIGVYEPMVRVEDGRARRTSALAERGADGPPAPSFHDACYPPAAEPDEREQ
jgi:hypothetical protein